VIHLYEVLGVTRITFFRASTHLQQTDQNFSCNKFLLAPFLSATRGQKVERPYSGRVNHTLSQVYISTVAGVMPQQGADCHWFLFWASCEWILMSTFSYFRFLCLFKANTSISCTMTSWSGRMCSLGVASAAPPFRDLGKGNDGGLQTKTFKRSCSGESSCPCPAIFFFRPAR